MPLPVGGVDDSLAGPVPVTPSSSSHTARDSVTLPTPAALQVAIVASSPHLTFPAPTPGRTDRGA